MGQLEQITASAGSGKTYTLIRRFLELLAASGGEGEIALRDLARPGARPHAWPEILAATFTNAAASEMKERLIKELKTYALEGRAEEAPSCCSSAKAETDSERYETSLLTFEGEQEEEDGSFTALRCVQDDSSSENVILDAAASPSPKTQSGLRRGEGSVEGDLKGSHPFWPPSPELPLFTPAAAQERLEVMLRRFGSINIRTIDSLLTMLVRLSALDFGLPPDFEPVFGDGLPAHFELFFDEIQERARLAGEAAEKDAAGAAAAQEPARQEDAELNDLLLACCRAVRADVSRAGFMAPADFTPVLLGLICHIWERGEFKNPASDEALAAAGRALREELARAGLALRAVIGVEDLECNKNFITFLDKLAAWCKNEADFAPPESVFAGRGDLAGCLNKKSAPPSEQAETAFSLWQFAYGRAVADTARIYEARRILPYARLAARLAGPFKTWLADKGLIPSNLLDGYAREILARELGPSEAYCRFGARLEHLLVDEFQDTSRAQWRAIEPLAEECLAGGGSVIYVGDVKQAIYGWRGGDAALFQEIAADPVLTRIAGGATVTVLPANWRSLGRIVELNNTVFGALKNRDTALETARAVLGRECPAEIAAETARDFTDTFGNAAQELPPARAADRERGYVRLVRLGGGAVASEDDAETLIYYDNDEAAPPPQGDAAANLSGYADLGMRAREVYRRMRAMLLDDILLRRAPGEVAVLTRGNAEGRTVARWLSAWGVPTITENSLLLNEHPLIAQIIAFLRFMDNPLDDPALFEFLCSEDIFAAAGLDAAALHSWLLNLPERREPLFSVFRRDFPEAWGAFIAPFYLQAGLMSAYDLTCEMLRHFGVWARRPEDAVFLRRFLELLHGAEERDMQSLPEFLDWWSGAGNVEKLPVAESLDAVRIMTMHKAKGLEFPVVIAPFNDFPVKAGHDFERAALAGGEVLLKPRKAFGETYFRDLARQAREAMHLVYVAWTRAAEELYALLPPEEANDVADRLRRGAAGAPVSRALDVLLAGLPFDEDGVYEAGEPEGIDQRAARPLDSAPGDNPLDPERAGGRQRYSGDSFYEQPKSTWHENDESLSPEDGSNSSSQSGLRKERGAGGEETLRGLAPCGFLSPGVSGLMSWLPRLKIYRNVHGSQGGAARERGVLIHNCLEHLRFSGGGAAEVQQAALRAFMHARRVLNLPRLEEAVYREIMDMLIWVLSLPEAAQWFAKGRPEQEILTGEGARKVADRLALTPRGAVVLEYKTGAADLPPAALPLPEHMAQLRGYLALVEEIRREPAEGRLIYLDRREVYPVRLERTAP